MWWSTLFFIRSSSSRGRVKGCTSILPLQVELTTLLLQLRTEVNLPDRHDHFTVARAVQLDQHDCLPGAEREPAVLDRDHLTWPKDRCLEMGGAVAIDLIVAPSSCKDELIESIEQV